MPIITYIILATLFVIIRWPFIDGDIPGLNF